MDITAAKLGANMAVSSLTASGQMGSEKIESATSTHVQDGDLPANTKSVVGMTATYTITDGGFYFLREPKMNWDVDYQLTVGTGSDLWYFANNTNGGMLSKRVFGIGGNISAVCPSFAWNYPNFTNLAYAYEDTSDNLGVGVTLPKGWYALNATTFEATPFNLKDNPVIIPSFDELEITGTGDYPNIAAIIKENWFELEEQRTFTISEKNVLEGSMVFAADMTNFKSVIGNASDEFAMKIMQLLAVANLIENTENNWQKFTCKAPFGSVVKLVLSWKIPAYIEPKYLPIGYEQKVLFDGKPTRMDLSNYGLGIVYAMSSEDLIPLAEGQDIHYEYTANGETKSGVLLYYHYQSAIGGLSVGADDGMGIAHSSALGMTAFSYSRNLVAIDLGEVTNLKMWIEYRYDRPYILRYYMKGTEAVFLPISHDKAVEHGKNGSLQVRGNGYYTTVWKWMPYQQTLDGVDTHMVDVMFMGNSMGYNGLWLGLMWKVTYAEGKVYEVKTEA